MPRLAPPVYAWKSIAPSSSRRHAGALGALTLITLGILLLRLPSFFEPPWNTDEGIFAAVAQRVLEGGKLYADAWESKPPLFLYMYVGIFKVFGPGVFGLRLAATLFAAGTHLTVFFIALRFMSVRRALIAAALCGVLLGVPFWEGTLALTETFTVLPAALGVLLVVLWDDRARLPVSRTEGLLVAAGALFAVAFLLRQTSVAAPAAAGIWLVLRGRDWRRATVFTGAGFASVLAPVLGAFSLTGDFAWFWDANVGFFFKYVPSGQQLPFGTRPLIALPFLVTVAVLLLSRRRDGETPLWSLPALWLTLTLAGALLTGRPYAHYLLQTFPPLAMLAAMASPSIRAARPRLQAVRSPRFALAYMLVAALALEWFYVVVPMFGGNVLAMHYTRGPSYYVNFGAWAVGMRSEQAYDNYFDKRVALTRSLEDVLKGLDAEGQKVYIWGEYPWVYPLADVKPTTRYMTSFYVLLLPYLDVELAGALNQEKPTYIVVMSDAKPKLSRPSPIIDQRWGNATRGLNTVLARDYQLIARVGRAEVYRRSPEHLTPTPNSGVFVPLLREEIEEP